MADTDSTLSQQRGLTPWKPGQSGNPKGTRNKLGEQFISDVCWDGRNTAPMRSNACVAPIRRDSCASWLASVPKDLPTKDNKYADWGDEELDEAIEMIRAYIAEENSKKTGNRKQAPSGEAGPNTVD